MSLEYIIESTFLLEMIRENIVMIETLLFLNCLFGMVAIIQRWYTIRALNK